MAQETSPIFVQSGKSEFPDLDEWEQITDEEVGMAADMARRNELSGGTPVVREFEAEWRERCGTKHALTVVNGTSALYSAFFGLGVGPGDEVLCPTYTWICTIAPAPLLGARPVFCESDPQSMMIDSDDVRRRVTDKTAAIVAVHLWGNLCDMDALMAVSEETGVPVVEDCSHAHGATYKGRACGSIGHVGCWSLQGSKPVSAGEGGVLVTNDTDIFERACLVGQVNRIKGVDLVTQKYEELQPFGLGMKFRAHPVGIGVAQVQLRKLDDLNARRRAFVEEVEAGLSDIPVLDPVKVYDGAQRGGFYGFPTLYRPDRLGGLSRDELLEALKAQGLPAHAGGYPLLHELPLFAKGFDVFTRNRGPLCGDYPGHNTGDFPITENMHQNLVFLPVLSKPKPEAPGRVLEAIRRAVDESA